MSYPSLSFVEYNASQDGFFTPLVYLLAGHLPGPGDAGEGPKSASFLLVVFSAVLGF